MKDLMGHINWYHSRISWLLHSFSSFSTHISSMCNSLTVRFKRWSLLHTEDIFNLVKKTKQTQVLAKHEQKQNVTELVHSWITVFLYFQMFGRCLIRLYRSPKKKEKKEKCYRVHIGAQVTHILQNFTNGSGNIDKAWQIKKWTWGGLIAAFDTPHMNLKPKWPDFWGNKR